MSDIELTIQLPEELVERARAAGIDLSAQSSQFVEWLEAEVARYEAGTRLRQTMDKLWAMNDKPSPEEIEAEIRAARDERTSKRSP
ncbi:MAG: hypothetical protein IH587_14895 [Anaerolineae bacterium]|nr:hypothetical protein [Anaerolineae bacterium]